MPFKSCYVLQIFEILDCCRGDAEESGFSSAFLAPHRGLNPGMQAFIEKGKRLADWDLFVCRSFEKAKELMLDGVLLSVDWISCYEEDEDMETGLAIFKSTDRRYIGRIFRTELF